MITLYQFSPQWGIPNPSPFCLKVETYLRMADLPYKSRYVNDPRKAPKGKLPYLKIDNEIIADSGLILDALQTKYPNHPDVNLTPEQHALKLCVTRMLEEHLYWVALYSRWQDPQGWPILEKAFFSRLPWHLKLIIPRKLRQYMINQIKQAGLGRHTPEEIYAFGIADIKALATLMGDTPYFFGDEPTSIDATIHSFTANALYTPFENPLKSQAQSMPTLVAHCDRMHQRYYKDWSPKKAP